jgi:hypothetical protein
MELVRFLVVSFYKVLQLLSIVTTIRIGWIGNRYLIFLGQQLEEGDGILGFGMQKAYPFFLSGMALYRFKKALEEGRPEGLDVLSGFFGKQRIFF